MLAKINAFRWDMVLLFRVFGELSRRVPRLLKTRLLSLVFR